MRKKSLQFPAVVLVAFVVGFVAIEEAVRLLGSYDENGRFTFMGHTPRPYLLPVDSMQRSIDEYFARPDEVRFLYDPALGWTYAPSRTTGEYTINAAGLRANDEYALTPLPNTLRIALFGDSFTAGDEIPYEATLGYLLEDDLKARGYNVEVLNFGVGGYGMDQAYLRWQAQGRAYAPDIVVFGFQPENMTRNLNILPIYLRQDSAPFSKPRFVLENGALRLVNSPPVPPEDLVDLYANFARSPLAPYEGYLGRDYVSPWWLESKFLALIDYFIRPPAGIDRPAPLDVAPFVEGSDYTVLAEAIVDVFAVDVTAANEQFVVLHLPHPVALYMILNQQPVPYLYLIDRFAQQYPVIRMEDAFTHWDDAYKMPGNHYSPEATPIIAAKMADDLVACLESGACHTPRFASVDEYRTPEGDAQAE
jgi:hypothetical protein